MKNNKFSLIFLILCLGYLIDYYDMSIFAAARLSILKDLQVPDSESMSVSKLMFDLQALGFLIGGLVSGVWGDKIGRVSAVRVGVFIFSSAMILNTLVHTVALFSLFRFLAGVGLAGELAASVTLLSEMAKQENRGQVASFVYFFGLLGGIVATSVTSFFDWKTLFLAGGIAGFVLLGLRKFLVDSTIFLNVKNRPTIPRGSLKLLLGNPRSLLKVLKLTFCFVPFWLMIFFINFSPEIAAGIGITTKINLSQCMFLFFIGSLVGVVLFPQLNKIVKSHKKTILSGFLLMFISVLALCFAENLVINIFPYVYLLVGLSTGYFGIYMVLLAENFGTNQRSTGTTFTSNLSRTTFILVNSFVPFVIQLVNSTVLGAILSAAAVILISTICLIFTKETYGASVDYTE